MELEMILRLTQKYEIVDLGVLVGYSFYHLEHVNPRLGQPRHTERNRQLRGVSRNPDLNWRLVLLDYCPNPPDWGLATFPLEAKRAVRARQEPTVAGAPWYDRVVFGALVASTGAGTVLDWFYGRAVFATRRWLPRITRPWLYRARRVRAAVSGQPLGRWPGLVMELKRNKKERPVGTRNKPSL